MDRGRVPREVFAWVDDVWGDFKTNALRSTRHWAAVFVGLPKWSTKGLVRKTEALFLGVFHVCKVLGTMIRVCDSSIAANCGQASCHPCGPTALSSVVLGYVIQTTWGLRSPNFCMTKQTCAALDIWHIWFIRAYLNSSGLIVVVSQWVSKCLSCPAGFYFPFTTSHSFFFFPF